MRIFFWIRFVFFINDRNCRVQTSITIDKSSRQLQQNKLEYTLIVIQCCKE